MHPTGINKNAPIGVFDSGVGGLTVVKELTRLLPQERIIYLADTKRLPYGNRKKDEIVFWVSQAAKFLLQKNIKLLILACHTGDACALEALQEQLSIPVLGIIQPGINEFSSKLSGSKKIAILGTPRLIQSEIYQTSLHKKHPSLEIHAISCPQFASLVEEGNSDNSLALEIVQQTLLPLKGISLDAVFLACTHYPFLISSLKKVLQEPLFFLNPAEPCALFAKRLLTEKNLLSQDAEKKDHEWLTSMHPERLFSFAKKALGEFIQPQLIELE